MKSSASDNLYCKTFTNIHFFFSLYRGNKTKTAVIHCDAEAPRMAVVLILIVLKSIMLLLVFHSYVTDGRTLNTVMQGRDECPIPCSCYNRTVICNDMHLREVPFNIPPRTRALYLNDNAIDKLDFGLLSRLGGLEELHVRGNKLEGIKEKDIEFLPRLRHLDMRDNPLVCDCPLANVVGRKLDDAMPLDVILGDTKCVAPMQDEQRRASDVLRRLDCRHRSRRGEMQCNPRYCLNGGTCSPDGTYCECPDSFVGKYCERPYPALQIYLEDITASSVKVTWRGPHRVDRYYVLFQEHSLEAEPKYIWTKEHFYIFYRLSPGVFYEVCVTGYISDEINLDECCKEFTTQPHPSRPEVEHPEPPPHPPGNEPKERQSVIQKAAVILGSIIGVCAFFIICLTLVYKFRTLRNPRNWGGRSPSPPIDDEAEAAIEAETEAETELSQDRGHDNNTSHDVFVVSVPAPDQATAPPEDDPIEQMNRVLQALQPQSSRGSHETASPNPLVLYRPEHRNRNTAEDATALSRDNPSGTTPIFLVADGNHYPLDPALSQVLCSAMSRSNISREPLPNEPPPPYSERAEDAHPTQPQFETG